MALTTRNLDIPEEIDPVLVLGPDDSIIREIERAFPHVSILVRGNRIFLSASDAVGNKEAGQAYELLKGLIQTSYQDPLDADQVGQILDHKRLDMATVNPIRTSTLPSSYDVKGINNEGLRSSKNMAALPDVKREGQKIPGLDADRLAGISLQTGRTTTSEQYGVGIHMPDHKEEAGRPVLTHSREEGGREDHDNGHHQQGPIRRAPLAYSSLGPIRPKTAGQVAYVSSIQTHTITFGIGPAGTGKTYLAVAKAVQAFQDKQVSRIILTRPAVEAGENLGFLPGSLNEKVDPYLRPLYDALSDMLGPDRMHHYLSKELIEVAPLAYMRGRTLNDAFVILDEAQNTTRQQMKMFLTRLGSNAKMVITGDLTQVDLGLPSSGLATIEDILGDIDEIGFVHLEAEDVVRNRLVGKIVRAYDMASKKGNRSSERI